MAKNKKKIANNLLQKQAKAKEKDFAAQKSLMQQFMADEQYVEAMDVMAEMATAGSLDTEIMYWGAKCYFVTQDYERSAKWINHVLNYDNNHVPARILLAQLCFAEGRSQQGMQILEQLLGNYEAVLTTQDRQDIKAALPSNVVYQQEDLEAYPALADLLELSSTAAPEAVAEEKEEASDTAAVLQKLRNLLRNQQADNEAIETQAETVPLVEDDCEEPVCAASEEQATEAEVEFSAAAIIQDVMSRQLSLAEKIQIINTFAGGCYQADDYENAYALLAAALKLDAGNQLLLQNFIYTCLALGKREQAIAVAAELPMVDFALLKALKD